MLWQKRLIMQRKRMNDQKSPFLVYVIIVLLPFLFFYWMLPFVSRLTIGSDYLEIIRMQMELLFSIRTGSFPLYVPGFASGHSSSALTLGQIYHPVSYIASIVPGYWEGKLIDVNNLLKLLSLGLAHLTLFAFLRKIRLTIPLSFIISLITVYNLRILDLWRYGPALEAYTEYIYLCAAIGWYFLSPTRWLGPLCIIGATFILVCNGHPQMMYYGLLGAALFTLVMPFFISDLLRDGKTDYRMALRFWVKAGFCIFVGIILSSAYIVPFYFDFISMNIDRMNQDYTWANENLDTFIGTVNNFILPLRSEAHGAFGGSSLIYMAAILPVLVFFRVKIPRSVWAIWGLLLLLFLYMQGPRTPFHRLAWEYLPLASSFRTAGRISMIMPVPIMLLLAWAVSAKPLSHRTFRFSFLSHPSGILAFLSGVSLVVYYLIYIAGYHLFSLSIFKELFPTYSAGSFFHIPFVWVEFITIMCGTASLAVLAPYGMRTDTARKLGIVFVIAVLMQTGITLKYRSAFWIGNTYISPTFEDIREQKRKKMDYLYYPGGGMHSSIVNTQLERSFIEPFLGKIFTHVIAVDSQDDGYNKMERRRLPHQIFVEGYGPDKAKTLTEGAKSMNRGTVKLIYSSYNRLQFHVNSQSSAIFGLSYPFTGNWSAWSNGERVQIYRANGASHAVEIPEGESLIEFRYWSSASFWGMAISCITLAAIGLFICFGSLRGLRGIIGISLVLIMSTGGFMLWYNSLYNGDNLETEYTWTYDPPSKTDNLAYGKRSWMDYSYIPTNWNSPHAQWHINQLDLYASRLVDGNRSPGAGFSSQPGYGTAWFIDLHRNEGIRKVLLFESRQEPHVNVRPITVEFSLDEKEWTNAVKISTPLNRNNPIKIILDKPHIARFIKVGVSGESELSFDEVEVYGTGSDKQDSK